MRNPFGLQVRYGSLPRACLDTRAQATLQRATWMAGRRANVTVSPVACGTRASTAIDARVYKHVALEVHGG